MIPTRDSAETPGGSAEPAAAGTALDAETRIQHHKCGACPRPTSLKVRKATKPKSIRLGLEDGSIIAVGFLPKGKGKSVVAIEHNGLRSADAAAQVKTDWAARFDALGGVLAEVLAAK